MPASAPTTARIPPSVTNVTLRVVERDDGGAGGSTRSRPSVIDRANNRLRLNFSWPNFIWPMRLLGHCSKFPAGAGLHLRHGYPGGPVRGPWASFAALLRQGSEGWPRVLG